MTSTIIEANRAPARRAKQVEALAPERFAIRCTVDGLTRAKLERAQDLVRHQVPDGDLAAVLELALDALIDRAERRRFGKADRPRPAGAPAIGSRTVPAAVQRAVVERDGERCAYVAASGRRCTATTLLEFHHVDPFGKGGESTVDNVFMFCRSHNQYAAEVDYGRALMERLRARPVRACEATMPWPPPPPPPPLRGRGIGSASIPPGPGQYHRRAERFSAECGRG